jgi:polar amino acid transport system substrate-binding protein
MPEISKQALAELAPSGRLRAAVAVGEAVSAVWNIRDPQTGTIRGVAADLARAMADRFGLALELVEHKSSAAIIAAAANGTWDVGFTPVDAERKKHVDFSTDYFLGTSTYLVRAGVAASTLAEIDVAGIRIVGIEGTATLRAARKSLHNASTQGLAEMDEALALFSKGEADALALGRESLVHLSRQFPGSRVLNEYFLATGTAVAVPLGRPQAVDLVSRFVESAKTDGTLRSIFDRNGLVDQDIPPLGSMS